MIVTLKDGSKKEYAESKSVYEIALDISEGLARAACAGEVNGEVVDLRTQVSEDCELNILTANDEKGLAALRHTASHVLAEAVKLSLIHIFMMLCPMFMLMGYSVRKQRELFI